MSCPSFDIVANCTDPGYPIEFDADPDVAGIGEVILAFLFSAWATFLFVTISFFFVDSFDSWNNEIDWRIIRKTRKARKWIRPLLPQILKTDRPFSFDAIEKIAFTLSDQQLITGISIFIVGFARHCIITQYHFYVVYLLGNLSFSTHQSTMMIVRKKLRKCRWMRWWRLAGIFLIFAFSFAANIPVYNWYFLAELGLVMQCVWGSLPYFYTPEERGLTILTSLFLFWGFIAVIRDICPEVGDVLGKPKEFVGRSLGQFLQFFSPRNWHYLTRRRLAEAQTQGRNTVWWLLNWISFLFFLVYFTIIQIVVSRIVDLYRIWTTLFYATFAVLNIRSQAAHARTADGSPALNGDENTWGFGQILPILLLVLPASQVWEMAWEDIDSRRKRKKEKQKDEEEQEKDKTKSTTSIKSSTSNPPQDESISMQYIPSTVSTDQSPLRQEIGEYYRIEFYAPGNDTLEKPVGTGSENMTTVTGGSEFYKPRPEDERHDQGRPTNVPRVNTVNLEKGRGPANSQTSSESGVSTCADGFEVEEKLFNSWWFWIWLWFWILALFGATTYGATQGIVF